MLKLRLELPESTRVRSFFYYLFVIAAPSAVFLWKLSSQTTGLSLAEASLRNSAKLTHIVENPLNLPYKLLENLLYHSGLGHVFAMRLTSAIFGMLFVVLFFYVLKAWFGKPIALLTVILMSLTPLYLLSSRTATANIMMVSTLGVLFAYYHLTRSDHTKLSLALVVAAIATCLYTPGLVWILFISSLFMIDKIIDVFYDLSKKAIFLSMLCLLIIMAPLIYGFVQNPALIRNWLLIPNNFPQYKDLVRNLAWSLSGLLYRSRDNSVFSVGRLPLLNAIQIGLLAFGGYVLFCRMKRVFFWIFTSLIIVIALTSLNNSFEQLLMALPFIAFMSGMGLRYLFVEWRRVFPKNPLAKAFAITLMSAVVIMHTFFGIRYSLLAWPATEQVRHTYVLK